MTMEVACPQCSAKYQFDASAIPAQGYDAQCTGCGGVFFVAPEQPVDPQISVACNHCGAVYQFPASAIPAEGYDAQCTQCQQVFFVSATPQAAAPAQPEPVEPSPPVDATTADPPVEATPQPPVDPAPAAEQPVEPVTPIALPEEPTPLTDLKALPQEPVALDTPKQAAAEPAAESPESATREMAVETPADPAAPDTERGHDMMALSAELGEPDESPDGVSLEDDFGTIMQRRRKRRTILLVTVAAVLVYSLVTYRFAPRVFDLTVGRVVPIKLTVDPEAMPHVDEGLARMLDDTDAAYQEALVEFDAALAIDDRYPDAIAYKGLTLVFRGSDIQARGRVIRQDGEDAINEMKALEELPSKRRPKDATARIAELRKRATAAGNDAAKLFEAGGKTVREGFALLRDGLKAYKDVPLVVEAAGVYYTTDSDSVPRAGVLLRHSLALRLGPDEELNLEDAPNSWLPYLQALVRSTERKGEDAARAAFVAAIKKEPRFQRARYELALFEEKQGKVAEAERLANEILTAVADHDKAKELLARAATSAAPLEEAKPPPAPSKGKKRKRKRR